jgi:putative component of membrane protein insertase Oxa1/YidC/SpoIIIJ protein YidD
MIKKNIPAIAFAGMFFFCAWTGADTLQFSVDLFEKNEWELCRRECRRALLAHAEPVERFQLLEAMAAIRSGIPPADGIAKLTPIIEANKNPQVSSIASYDLGRLHWQIDQPEQALNAFSYSFNTTTNKSLFLRSSCSMFLLFEDHPKLRNGRKSLVSQINTSRGKWYGALFSECAKPDPVREKPNAPNWIVRFYRSQISPAIGDRCTLEPSCSEYFHQAHQHHGLKSFPMIADRFFREPEVSSQKKDPIVMENGRIRYRDPIENHDFWMKKK